MPIAYKPTDIDRQEAAPEQRDRAIEVRVAPRPPLDVVSIAERLRPCTSEQLERLMPFIRELLEGKSQKKNERTRRASVGSKRIFFSNSESWNWYRQKPKNLKRCRPSPRDGFASSLVFYYLLKKYLSSEPSALISRRTKLRSEPCLAAARPLRSGIARNTKAIIMACRRPPSWLLMGFFKGWSGR